MCTLSKRGRGRRQEEEQQHVSSRDTEARGVKEGKLCFLVCPLAGKVEQVLLLLFLFSFISFSFISTLLSFDTSGPAEASTGSRNNNVKDHQAHKHNDNSQLEVLHTHGSCKVTTCGLKCHR